MLDRVTKRPFVDYARQNLYVTPSGLFFEEYFRRAVGIVGIDRVLFSTDYPYQYRRGRDAIGFLGKLAVSEPDRQKFAFANWERLTSR